MKRKGGEEKEKNWKLKEWDTKRTGNGNRGKKVKWRRIKKMTRGEEGRGHRKSTKND